MDRELKLIAFILIFIAILAGICVALSVYQTYLQVTHAIESVFIMGLLGVE